MGDQNSAAHYGLDIDREEVRVWPNTEALSLERTDAKEEREEKPAEHFRKEILEGVNMEAIQDLLANRFTDDTTPSQDSSFLSPQASADIAHAHEDFETLLARVTSTEELTLETSTPQITQAENPVASSPQSVTLPYETFEMVCRLVNDTTQTLLRLQELLRTGGASLPAASASTAGTAAAEAVIDGPERTLDRDSVVEGVFNGQHMIGPDGKQYTVPANYASKSKLLEGDILKLTIADNGRFIYKQIHPIDRTRIMGKLERRDNDYYVRNDSKSWRVLTASVTYFKGKPGDEAIVLVPQNGESSWAAVENIIARM